eukprot:15079907-Alexandrium_andersonii.AAC.1
MASCSSGSASWPPTVLQPCPRSFARALVRATRQASHKASPDAPPDRCASRAWASAVCVIAPH